MLDVYDRNAVREYLIEKIAGQRRTLADPHSFATVDPNFIIADAQWRLRWLDCAPAGARFGVAPLQDKRGVPMGDAWDENVGPCRALRDVRIAHGVCPFSGRRPIAFKRLGL